ncbi:MAG: L-serine ammonia-lyase, iron-sulfur-dependent, subunit alpha [Candidatus Korarchaeum sp.]
MLPLTPELVTLSVLNHVIGPVIRGPSSSHTGASYFIGKLARELLLDELCEATVTFDEGGSYAKVYKQEASDLAFVSGLLGLNLEDESFRRAIEASQELGVKVKFRLGNLGEAPHPNEVLIELKGRRKELRVRARSIGGGMFEIIELNGVRVRLKGDEYLYAYETSEAPPELSYGSVIPLGDRFMVIIGSSERKEGLDGGRADSKVIEPIFLPLRGKPIFSNAEELRTLCEREGMSLGEAGMKYESELLGIEEEEVAELMLKRYEVMKSSIEYGMSGKVSLRTLKPSASSIYRKLVGKELPVGGPHSRAAALAMAVMHACNSNALVVAAPTGGSAGVIPGVLATLEEEKGLSERDLVRCLFAAGAVGLLIGSRATFAAEEAGCQVEIGAAGAMASALVIEAFKGSCEQALNAAAISLQNIVGMVCDPVGGYVEVPCHTRNAVAAASAFVNADLVMGGYDNPIPLDETVDAVYSVGRMLPSELKCTAMGGLAACPSAAKFKVWP